jgi:hypothetical protein
MSSDGASYVLFMINGGVQVKSLMSIVTNFVLGVDGTLLKRHLAVVMPAVGVLTSPTYWMKLPPTVNRMHLVSVFSGHTLATTRK